MNFANLAMDFLTEGKSGYMTGLQDGKYTAVPLHSITGGIKRVDVDRYYDTDQYRADVRNVSGMPMFLT